MSKLTQIFLTNDIIVVSCVLEVRQSQTLTVQPIANLNSILECLRQARNYDPLHKSL